MTLRQFIEGLPDCVVRSEFAAQAVTFTSWNLSMGGVRTAGITT
eukprot:CAMPEP_0185913234 /NCGR_PEP_ID=MMETSP0196C-20130402/42981_1 /TAXON_ID=2932 /ORGANISM="Alexandrium fundyense, Strain CCMP1719" /LENGTH=43 /DNA_ID= /DNA_START= /DNA_END= /DNA_ORIENTATION=